jgi:hypothetical protein
MTFATFRAAVEHTLRAGTITPHQLAAWEAAWRRLPEEQKRQFTEDWRAQGSPAAPPPARNEFANLQSWLSYFTSDQVTKESQGRIAPLTPAEACGFIGCIIVETGSADLSRLDVVEAGSGRGRGAMQYTGVRRIAYDKARSAAIAQGTDPNSNRWQQLYFAQEYAGLLDPPQGSLIGWTKVFERRPAALDPSRAAAHWTAHYFRPGMPHLERRQAEARRVWGLVQSGRLSAQQRPAVELQQAPGRVTPASPFSALLTPHIKLGEFALNQEARRFHHQYQVDTAIKLAQFLERVRTQFGGPVIILSGYRPPAINRSIGGDPISEHLYREPDWGAVDFWLPNADMVAVQNWVLANWPESVGKGWPKRGFIHLGIGWRRVHPFRVWDY